MRDGLTQKQAGLSIGVDAFTVLNWEKAKTTPSPQDYPGIIHFLEYIPLPEPTTLAERLYYGGCRQNQHRLPARLVFCRFAVLVGIAAGFPGFQGIGMVLQMPAVNGPARGVVRINFLRTCFDGIRRLLGSDFPEAFGQSQSCFELVLCMITRELLASGNRLGSADKTARTTISKRLAG